MVAEGAVMANDERLTLRPHWGARAGMVFAVWFAGFLVVGLSPYPPGSDATGAIGLTVVVALVLLGSYRMLRLGVDATADTVTVRGLVLVRRIPLRSVTGAASVFSPLEWADATGARRTTRLWPFEFNQRLPFANTHAKKALLDLEHWVDLHQEKPTRPTRRRHRPTGGRTHPSQSRPNRRR